MAGIGCRYPHLMPSVDEELCLRGKDDVPIKCMRIGSRYSLLSGRRPQLSGQAHHRCVERQVVKRASQGIERFAAASQVPRKNSRRNS